VRYGAYDTTSDTSIVVQTDSDIASGDCPESPTLTDDPREAVCSSPATRIFVALSAAVRHQFTPLPQTLTPRSAWPTTAP